MIFFFDKNGVPIDVVTNRIFQNSNKANTIFFVYPVENQASIGAMFVNVAFTLPNGENKPQRVMKPLVLTTDTGLNGVIDLDGNKFFIWEYDLKSDVTSYAGTVTCQFFVTVSGELITTESSTFLVEQGVPVSEPIEDDRYQELLDYFTNVLAPSLNLNLENGTGDYSIIQKTAEGEENQATAEGSYAGGKKSKSTAKRGFTHGNTVENNGNSAASFGQVSENNGNVALTQGAGYYNGGDLAVLVGGKLYNCDNYIWTVPSNAGGAAAALFGAFIYNKGSHSLNTGYLIKNSRAMSVKLGRANEDKAINLFELASGKQLVATKHDGYNTFVYNDEIYTINYDGETAVSITHPNGSVFELDNSFRTHLQDDSEICIGGNINAPQVFIPYNIFEIDELGTIVAQGGLHVKKARSLAEMELESDGLRVQGKVQSNGKVSGDTGDFAHGLDVKTRGLAEFKVDDDGAKVTGSLLVSNPPSRPTDVVRLTELDAVKQTIETLHKNGFVVVSSLPTASYDTVGKIYLVPQEESSTNNIYDEYITIETSTNAYTWEKIGSTQFTLIVDNKLSLTSMNPVKNYVITQALGEKLSIIPPSSALPQVYIQYSNETHALMNIDNGYAEKDSIVRYSPDTVDITPVGGGMAGRIFQQLPNKPYHVANKKYVDDAINPLTSKTEELETTNTTLTAKTNEMQRDIKDLYLLSNATVTGTEELTQEYSERQTADGLSGLIDGALTRVTKVQGNTVAVDNTLKNSYFKGVVSTNSDGTKTDESFMLDNAVELGKWDYIDTATNKLIRQTETLVIDGVNNKLGYINEYASEFYTISYLNAGVISDGNGNTIVASTVPSRGISPTTPYDNGVYATNNNLVFWIRKSAYPNITNLAQANAYFAENPCVVAYQITTATETDIEIPNNKYQAWVGGTETQVQGDINNSEYGANNTITQTYAVIKGGAE